MPLSKTSSAAGPRAPRPAKPKGHKRMTLKQALHVLMRAASNDATGAGTGIRSTSDAWRLELARAWQVAHKYVYGWEPDDSAFRNAGMAPPSAWPEPVPKPESKPEPVIKD